MKDTRNSWISAQELGQALRNQEIAFLVGAGISAKRQSWLPTWRELTESMLFALAGESGRQAVALVMPHLDRLLTEVIFQLMIPEIGQELAFVPLQKTMSSENYSAIHKFLAWVIIQHNAVVLTTNYDTLIENAVRKGLGFKDFEPYIHPKQYEKWHGVSGALMKLHGTVDDLDSARFAINQVFRGLDPRTERAFRKVLENRILIVLGYRGADEFDINPILFDNERRARRIMWLVREGSLPEPWVQTYLRSAGEAWLEVDPDAFLNALFLEVSGGGGQQRDKELEGWRIIKCKPHQEGWWKPLLIEWGQRLHNDHPGRAAFLWARILEYLYLYGEAARAYELARQLLRADVKELEARFRQAWMSRQASPSDAETGIALQVLQAVAEVIKTQLESSTSSADRTRLQSLLGAAMHQIGSALQGLKRFEEAKAALEGAEQIRKGSKDQALPYTVFQQFINARQASRIAQRKVDDLAPNGWRQWLSQYLADAASQYKKEGLVADYATTVHNRGFVHQFLAEELEKKGRYNDAEQEFQQAWVLDLEAWNYRHRLYDQRYVAQSEVRLAECELGFSRIAIQRDDRFLARSMAQRAFERATKVRELYARIPQQEFRTRDVERIEEEATRIITMCGFKPFSPYLR
ncbi:SIR2 family protein [Dehalococcoidia bacterium]|nr:SIR2 family protein [Dehalococcoidia bacterium]